MSRLVFERLPVYRQALDDYDRAINGGLNTANAYLSRGHAYSNLGQDQEAQAEYAKARSLEATSLDS